MLQGRAHLQIHFCVILWGFTSILGKLISLEALPLVWWRVTIVTGVLALTPPVWRGLRRMSPRLIAAYAGAGCLVTLHWLTFYGAIKLANASVGATCMGLAPAFLALVEPRIAGRRFEPRELLLGVAVIPGVALVVGGVPKAMHVGIAVGALSAVLVALFGAVNKRLISHADPFTVTAIELWAGALLLPTLSLLVPHHAAFFLTPGSQDFVLLVVLAVGCTLLPFTLSLVALRALSAFEAQLAVNLEPVYAVLLAIPLLHEHRELGARFYLGVAIILGSVLLYPALFRRPGTVKVDPLEGR